MFQVTDVILTNQATMANIIKEQKNALRSNLSSYSSPPTINEIELDRKSFTGYEKNSHLEM